MANALRMEMANDLISSGEVNIVSKFFGLSKDMVYTSTNSKVEGEVLEFKVEAEQEIKKLFNKSIEELSSMEEHGIRRKVATLGNIKLDICKSEDNEFVAIRLYKYEQYEYKPISDLKIFKGNDAKTMLRLI